MKSEYDGTYFLSEIAPVVRIPEGTLGRWRWRGELLTAVDYMNDPGMRRRIDEADARGEEFVRGAISECRCDLEDVTRLMVLGHLRASLGWDSERLIRVLRKPWIEPFKTQSDGHTARDQRVMPRFLIVYFEMGRGRLNRIVLDTWEQVAHVLDRNPLGAHLVDLRYFREAAQQQLALVELEREKRAAVKAERAAKAAKLAETEMAKV